MYIPTKARESMPCPSWHSIDRSHNSKLFTEFRDKFHEYVVESMLGGNVFFFFYVNSKFSRQLHITFRHSFLEGQTLIISEFWLTWTRTRNPSLAPSIKFITALISPIHHQPIIRLIMSTADLWSSSSSALESLWQSTYRSITQNMILQYVKTRKINRTLVIR